MTGRAPRFASGPFVLSGQPAAGVNTPNVLPDGS